jgi:adenylate cyclase
VKNFRGAIKKTNLQARILFEKAIELDPDYAEPYAFLGRTYLTELINQWSNEPDRIEKTFVYGQKAVALDPSQPTAHETLAYALLARREHEEAIAAARKAISFDPNFADGYITLGEILSFAGNPGEAIPLIEQAMRLNPKFTPNYLWALGHAHSLLGDNERAISVYKRVLTRNPDHFVSYLSLVVCYVRTGDPDAAREAAQEMLRISPNYSIEVAYKHTPYRDRQVIEDHFESLRKAGLK